MINFHDWSWFIVLNKFRNICVQEISIAFYMVWLYDIPVNGSGMCVITCVRLLSVFSDSGTYLGENINGHDNKTCNI